MKVRDARPEDNDALVALAAQCPMNADLSLCVDRRPDFFALSRLTGSTWRVGVIDGDTGPVACVGVARRLAYVNGDPSPVAYVGDLKVHPDHRRGGAGRALVHWATAAARELVGHDGPVLATVLSGNTAVEALRRRTAPAAAPYATIRSHSINLLWRRRAPDTGLTVRPAAPADAPEMARLWRRLVVGRQFAPVVESFAVDTPGLHYLLAHRPGGELVGFVGLWDQHHIKQTRVTGYSPRLAAAKVAFNAVAPMVRAPRLPSPGDALSYVTVAHPCATDPATLRTLLVHGCNRVRGRYSFVVVGLDTRDPLTGALGGMLAQPTDVGLLVLGAPAGDRPVHFEIATV